jgi:hypothetical protein
VYDDWAESPFSPTFSSNNIEGNEKELLFAFPFHQDATSALTVTIRGVFDQFATHQKTDDQGLLLRIVKGSIMTSTSGENTMIQGLNTNIDISLQMFRSFSFDFFSFLFF